MATAVAFGAAAEPAGSILEINSGDFVAGGPAEVSVTVLNEGDDDNDLLVEPTMPAGWSVDPGWRETHVATGETAMFHFTVTPPPGGGSAVIEWGLYYDVFGPFNPLLDTAQQPVVSDEAPGVDLEIYSLTLDPEQPAVGHEVKVTAVVRNAGGAAISSFLCVGGDIPVRFEADGEELAVEEISCGLSPGEKNDEVATFEVITLGQHTVTVTVDPAGDIEEVDESNNSATMTFQTAAPKLTVTPQLPAVSAPGLADVKAGVAVRNDSEGAIKDVHVALEIEGKTGLLDIGFVQGANLAPAEEQLFDAEVDMGLTVGNAPFPPGTYAWRYQVWAGGLPPQPGAVPLTEPATVEFEVVPTVTVTPDNVVVPTIEPLELPAGPAWSVTAKDVLWDGEHYTVTLGFSAPVDFLADGSVVVFDRLAFADVVRADGEPICDTDLAEQIVRGVLLWRDLVQLHPWYRSTYVALQEGYDWYYDEKHLKTAYYITQPFVVVHDLIKEAKSIGTEWVGWLKSKVGFGSPAEEEAGVLALETSMMMSKGYESLSKATQAVIKLSPLFAGEPYVSSSVISERLLEAIENGGQDLDLAITLVHDVMKEEAPDDYEKITQIITPGLVLNAVGNVLTEGVKAVLWQGVKKGFTAYFISKLSAKTAWKIVIGEGQATLMSGLTTAGVAQGIASFGLTLILTVEVAYLTYVGTFLDNVRGPGGLIEAGQMVAQSMPWTHVLYRLDGSSGPLDIDRVEDLFMAHAVMVEVYGFINSDLAMLKKLAFAKQQSQAYLDEAMSLFDVSNHQRDFATTLQAAASGVPSAVCGDDVSVRVGERRPRWRTPERGTGEHPSQWTKPDDEPAEMPADPVTPPDDVWWVTSEGPADEPLPALPSPAEQAGCQSGPTGSSGVWIIGLAMLALLRRRRLALVLLAALAIGCGDDGLAQESPLVQDKPDSGGTFTKDSTTPSPDTSLPQPDGDQPDVTPPQPDGSHPDIDPTCQCDDGIDCTKDECDEAGQCLHIPKGSAECVPQLTITTPDRGVVYISADPFEVAGTAVTATGSAAGVTLNGNTLPVPATGKFNAAVYPDHGINVIQVEATDIGHNLVRAVRAALVGDAFYPTTGGPTDKAVISRGILAWLGAEALDDNDLSDVDDFATLGSVILGGLDIHGLIPQPLFAEGEEPQWGPCQWTVAIPTLDFELGPVDFVPAEDALVLLATIKNLTLGLDATDPSFVCPEVKGTLTVPTISIQALVQVTLTPGGTVNVAIPEVELEIVEPIIDITGGFLSFFDWVFNWFNTQFAGLIELGVETAVKTIFAPAIQSALEQFTVYEQQFQIASLPGLGTPLDVTLGVAPTELEITQAGIRFGLGVQVTAPKGVPGGIDSPGALARNGCFGEDFPAPLELPTESPVALALHDDVINQVLFAAFWGGVMHASIDGAVLTENLGINQLTVKSVDLNPQLPPVLTSCTYDGALELQIGDLGVGITLDLNDEEGTIEAFVSGKVAVSFDVAPTAEGNLGLQITVEEVSTLGFQVVDATGPLDGSETIIDLMLSQVVVDLITDAVSAGFVQSIPVPSIDLGTVVPGVPAGTTVGFSPASLGLTSGYTVITGALSE